MIELLKPKVKKIEKLPLQEPYHWRTYTALFGGELSNSPNLLTCLKKKNTINNVKISKKKKMDMRVGQLSGVTARLRMQSKSQWKQGPLGKEKKNQKR